jgi:carboxypeptidase A4
MKYLLIGAIIFSVTASLLATRSYTGYKLLRLFPKTDDHVKLIQKLEDNPDFDIWNNAKGLKPQVDVLLSPSAFLAYSDMFDALNLKFEVVENNIQDKIDEQERSNILAKFRNNKNIVGTFASYTQIQSFMDTIIADNPTWITSETIGTSHENRLLRILRLKKGSPKRKVWIDCGIHARERISVAYCVWLIDYLTKNQEQADVKELLNYYEINIHPLVNPDGYEHARTSTPLWRKNRRVNTGSTCIGVDLNRNYGYKWMAGGASNNPCADTFAGPVADSEPETKAIENFLKKDTIAYDSFLTVHTYGLWWFTPWGYTDASYPDDYPDLKKKADIAKDAIKNSFAGASTYVTGSSAEILYIAAGGSDDWAKSIGIKHSCTLELRPGQSGVDANYGFLLPADRIEKTGIETTAGVIAFLKAIKSDNLGGN